MSLIKMPVGDCDQCPSEGVTIAKKIPSSGRWCVLCNDARLKAMKTPKTEKVNVPYNRNSVQVLIKALDREHSIFTRTKDMDENQIAKCCTCSVPFYWEDMDAGHCYARASFAIRWHPNNSHAQCKECNRGHVDGWREKHEMYIVRRYGQSALEELKALKNVVIKLDREILKQQIEMFKNLNQQNLSK